MPVMARSAGPPHPVGLARRSRRVVHAAVIAAAALVLSTAISGAQGDKPGGPPGQVAKTQAATASPVQQAQVVAAARTAAVDQQAQHVQAQATKKQGVIERKAAGLQAPAAASAQPVAAPQAQTAAPAVGTSAVPATQSAA